MRYFNAENDAIFAANIANYYRIAKKYANGTVSKW